jgi:hypothetical protein
MNSFGREQGSDPAVQPEDPSQIVKLAVRDALECRRPMVAIY